MSRSPTSNWHVQITNQEGNWQAQSIKQEDSDVHVQFTNQQPDRHDQDEMNQGGGSPLAPLCLTFKTKKGRKGGTKNLFYFPPPRTRVPTGILPRFAAPASKHVSDRHKHHHSFGPRLTDFIISQAAVLGWMAIHP